MAPDAGSMVQIGSVVNMKGQVFADHGDGVRPLSPGAPVHQGEVILTKAGANVEIKFLDDTVMSQGENSNLRLDSYAYDPNSGGSLLFNMAEGTFRTVTGKIADNNPENFKLKSPLATIGIRGTTVVSEIRGGVEKHGAEEIHSGKALTIQNALGQVQLVTSSRAMVDFRPDGSMGASRPFSVQEIQHFQSVTPIQSVPTFTAPPAPPQGGGQQQGGQQQGQQGQQGQQQGGGQESGAGATGGGTAAGGTGTGTGEGAGAGTGAGVAGGLIGGVFSGGAGGLGPSSLLAGVITGEGGGLKITVTKPSGQEGDNKGEQKSTEPTVSVVTVVVTTTENEVTTTTTSVVNDEQKEQQEQQQQQAQQAQQEQQQQQQQQEQQEQQDTSTGNAGVYLTATEAGETLVGTAYDDILMGMGGRNWLEGHGGSDILIGGSYDGLTMQGDIASFAGITSGVTASLAAGMATVDGKATALVNIMGLRGGDGNDLLIGDWTSNYLEGGLGNDTLVGAPNAASDYGDDVASYMHAAGGVSVSLAVGTLGMGNSLDLPASTPYGASTGGDGNDKLIFIENVIGSEYDDTLIGNAKENWFQGRGGADSIVGGSGVLSDGGQAIDTLSYEDQTTGVTVDLAAQTMTGGDAADIFSGIEGVDGTDLADTLFGNNDAVTQIGGQDVTLYGSNWFMGHGGDDVIDGGGHGTGGRDVAGYSHAPSAVSVNLDAGVLTQVVAGHAVGDTYGGSSGGDGDDTLFGIDGVEGSGYADTLVGSDDANWFQGNTGNDTIIGGLKADTDVDMASYDDATAGVTVDLNAGTITTGGDGYLGTAAYEDFHWHGTATPLVADGSLLGTSTGGDGNDILVNIEGVSGSDYADNINGNAQSNVLYGHGGNDTLFGGAGGDDLIRGGTGNDLIVMGSGMSSGDTIDGGDGIDTLYLEDSNPGAQDGQLAHVSTVESIVVTGGTAELAATPGLVAAGGGLVVSAAGLNAGASFTWDGHELGSDIGIAVTGSGGADTLTAGQGTDTLSGGAGNDTFIFGSNLDYTTGTAGTDSVDGGAGYDTLTYTDVDSFSFTGELDGVSHVEKIVISSPGDAYVSPAHDLLPQAGGLTIDATALSGGLHFDGSYQTADLTILGGLGMNAIEGGSGNDLIQGGLSGGLAFGSPMTVNSSAEVSGLLLADVNGDGLADLVAASSTGDSLVWHENQGEGSFGSAQVISASADGIASISAADMDLDGDVDVVAANPGTNAIVWYENQGGGVFEPAQNLTTSANGATSVFVADLNGDGKLDVVSSWAGDNKIAWFENLGGGSFALKSYISTSVNGASCASAADLDGDGDIDVLATSATDGTVFWFENDGNTAAPGFTEHFISTELPGASFVTAGDMNGDGKTDVVALSPTGGGLFVYLNEGGGAFQSPLFLSLAGATSVQITDLDGDGRLDLVAGSPTTGTLAWFRNAGSGTFDSAQLIAETSSGGATSVAVGDLGDDQGVAVFFNTTSSGMDYALVTAGMGDSLDGGLGANTVSYANATSGVVADLDAGTIPEDMGVHQAGDIYGTAMGGAGNDILLGIQNIVASSYDDTLIGSGEDNTFFLGTHLSSCDSIDGGAGTNTLVYADPEAGVRGYELAHATNIGIIRLTGGSAQVDPTATLVGAGTSLLLDASGLNAGASLELNAGSLTVGTGLTVIATDSSDCITAGQGVNSFSAGGGDDDIRFNYGMDSSDTVDGGAGYDSLTYIDDGEEGHVNELDHVTGVENISILGTEAWLTPASDLAPSSVGGYPYILTIDGHELTGGLHFNGASQTAELSIHAGQGDNDVTGSSGSGVSTMVYCEASAGVTVDLSQHTATHAGGTDTLYNIDGIRGSTHADTLTGDSGDNTIDGFGGDDTLIGGDGNDFLLSDDEVGGSATILAGAGNDEVSWAGQEGLWTVDGGSGTDVLYNDASGGMLEVSGQGADGLSGRTA